MADGLARSAAMSEPRGTFALSRRGRAGLAAAVLAGCAVSALAASALWKLPVLLVWNASASAPVGLYRLRAGADVRRGDLAVAWAPRWARKLAAARHYLPANVPLVKRVAAVHGDKVCAAGQSILINGRPVSSRQRSDAAGRPMPWWTGCRRLGRGEYFLLMDSPGSFDGRYFGVTRTQELVGPAVLLWAR
jgi:conjugative transfer signal peptidase TraF